MADDLVIDRKSGKIYRYDPKTNTWPETTGQGGDMGDVVKQHMSDVASDLSPKTLRDELVRGVVGVPGSLATMAEMTANAKPTVDNPQNANLGPDIKAVPDPNANQPPQVGGTNKAMLDWVAQHTGGWGTSQPKTEEGKVLGNILEMAPSAAVGGVAGGAAKGLAGAGTRAMIEALARPMASAAVGGATGQLAGDFFDSTGLEKFAPTARTVGTFLGGMAGPKAITPFKSQAANQQQAAILQRYGIPVQPGLKTGNETLQRLWQGWTGEPPGISGRHLTSAALRQTGVPANVASTGQDLDAVINPQIDQLNTNIRQSANRSGHPFRSPTGAFTNPTIMDNPDEITAARDSLRNARRRTAGENEFLNYLDQGINARAVSQAIPGSSGGPPGQLSAGALSRTSQDSPGLYGMSRAADQISNTGPQKESIFDPIASLALAGAGLAAPHFGIGNPMMDLGVMGLLAASPAAKVASRAVGLGTKLPGAKRWLGNNVLRDNSLSPAVAAHLLAARSSMDAANPNNEDSIINQFRE